MNIVIEVTRKCNLRCEHCLRGEPENKLIQEKYVEMLFSQLKERNFSINLLTLTGGEPALYPEAIKMIIETAKKYDIDIGNFYLATNGTINSDKFILSLIKLWMYCSENEISEVDISNDNFHDMELIQKNLEKFKALSFVKWKYYPKNRYRHSEENNSPIFPDYIYEMKNKPDTILVQGRGINRGDKEVTLTFWNDFLKYPEDTELYLNCNGNIILGGDWSYENQEEHKLCSVQEIDSYLKELNDFIKLANFQGE